MILSDRSIHEALRGGRIVISPFDPDNVQPASVDLRLFAPEPCALNPGALRLACTIEHVGLPDDIVARVEGKSSLGRIGLACHITAGFIDPGFYGQITLELLNVSDAPIVLTPWMLIAQVSFMTMTSPADRPYGSPGLGSHYQGQRGATPSHIFKDMP